MGAPTICGHERETLRWAAEAWAAIDGGTIAVYAYGTRQLKPSRSQAFDDLGDPAKLAAIVAELLRASGIDAHACHRASFQQGAPLAPFLALWSDEPTLDVWDGARWREGVSMSIARRFALALLDAPIGANVEQMIAEVAR